MEPISLVFREPHPQTNTLFIPICTCAAHLRGTQWADKGVEMDGNVLVSGLLRGLAALREHECLLHHQNCPCMCAPTCWHGLFFEFMGEGFSPISGTHSRELLQATSASINVDLMLSNLKFSLCRNTVGLKLQSNQWEHQQEATIYDQI